MHESFQNIHIKLECASLTFVAKIRAAFLAMRAPKPLFLERRNQYKINMKQFDEKSAGQYND